MTREDWVAWYVASGMSREDAEAYVDELNSPPPPTDAPYFT